MEKKYYVTPEMELIRLNSEDVIITSVGIDENEDSIMGGNS